MPALTREALVKRLLDTVYDHHGSACELLAVGGNQNSGTGVVLILETQSEEVGTGYANAGEFIHIGFTARFRRHELEDKNLVLAPGMTIIPTVPFAGHAAFEITAEPMPHGRKADQLIAQISPVDIP